MVTQDPEERPIVALNLSCGLCGVALCRSATDPSEHRTANNGIRADGGVGAVEPIPTGMAATSPTEASVEGASGETDPRTRRALEEEMNVALLRQGGTYEVHSESGNVYEVDVVGGKCTCRDWVQREPTDGCKHLRRVDHEIRAGLVPRPDGKLR